MKATTVLTRNVSQGYRLALSTKTTSVYARRWLSSDVRQRFATWKPVPQTLKYPVSETRRYSTQRETIGTTKLAADQSDDVEDPTTHRSSTDQSDDVEDPTTYKPLTDQVDNPEERAARRAEIAARKVEVPSYSLTFTCSKCTARSSHRISKQAYHFGTTVVTCPGCKNKHLISDHLKIFSDHSVTLEDIMKEKGQLIKRGKLGADGDVEFYDDESESFETQPATIAQNNNDEVKRNSFE